MFDLSKAFSMKTIPRDLKRQNTNFPSISTLKWFENAKKTA